MTDSPRQPLSIDPAAIPSDPAGAARAYDALGLRPIFLHPGEKSPAMKDWTEYPAERVVAQLEATPEANLGIMLGDPSGGLIDLDWDSRLAKVIGPRVAERLIGPTAVFGRAGKPAGHCLYLCADAESGRTLPFALKGRALDEALPPKPEEAGSKRRSAMIAEVRATGGQTVFPPSVFADGDRVVWHRGGTVPTVARADLERVVTLVCFLCVVAGAWPKSVRNESALHLTAILARLDWLTDEDVDFLVQLVAECAGDEEHAKRGGRAAETREKLKAGEHLTGLPKLCEHLGFGPALEKQLREWVNWGQPKRGRSAAPVAIPEGAILLEDGRLIENLEAAEAALRAGEVEVFQRGGELVRVVRLDASEDSDGVRRDRGATIIVPANEHALAQKLARRAKFVRVNSKGEARPADVPIDFTRHLARKGEWTLPTLAGVVNCPTMRRDGSILQTPGFDPGSGLLFDPQGVEFPPIPEAPTREDAEAALATIATPFQHFPYERDEPGRDPLLSASCSVALSAMLCAVARPAMRTVPIHCFDAPAAGSGKSIQAETVAIVATGNLPAMVSVGATEEETEKRLATAMRAGDPVIVIDNVEKELGGDFLCSCLTQERVSARILGKSERVVLPTSNTLFLATGNNLSLAGDLARRAVKGRIDSGEERPDKRAFPFDPRQVARDRRPELVAAALTVLRAFHVAGRPGGVPPMGSFEDYSLVRGALVWLGRADPARTREAIFAADPRRDELRELLALWSDAFASSPQALSEVEVRLGPDHPLRVALTDLGGRGGFNARAVGRRLAKWVDRPAGGLVLRRREDSHRKVVRWVVEPAQGSGVDASCGVCGDQRGLFTSTRDKL